MNALILAAFLLITPSAHAKDGAKNAASDQGKETAKTPETKPEKKGAKKVAETQTNTPNPTVVIETSMGNIEVQLNSEKAPISTKNFLTYVDEHFYDGTIFHRVIKDFMIQGGGFTKDMSQKSVHAPIKNEAANGLKNDRGTIAMARTSVVDSATAQFFINTTDSNSFLNYRSPDPSGFGYAVFGKVTTGMDVVDKIRAVSTGNKNGMGDVPNEAVVIKSVKRK